MKINSLVYRIVVFLVLSISAQEFIYSQISPPSLPPSIDSTSVTTNSIAVVSDSIPDVLLPYNFNNSQTGNLSLNPPKEEEVTFDPETQQYIVREKIGNYYVGEPIYMSYKEYQEYRLKKDMLAHYKEKLKAVGGRAAGSEAAQKDLLPKYYVKSKLFETIFGGNEIEVNVQGDVQIQLGVLSQTIENPQISERNRKSITFDFDQQISASINAKVGKRLAVTANYDTQSTFDFQNLIKLEFNPDLAFSEDDILQKIEVGNVSMPIKNSLVTGAQSLFGLKTELQFGKTSVTTVFAEQKSQTRTVAAEGGATINEFELRATDYDMDRHFFLSQAFRNNYDNALVNYPLINSQINIVKVEVWMTNRQSSTEDFRNIVAIADLAENDPTNIAGTNVIPSPGVNQDPSNGSNDLANLLVLGDPVREIATVSTRLMSYGITQGRDYSILENARKLRPEEFSIQPQLGYISLNRRLADSDVLAVSYEYTISGSPEVFKVGELTSDGVVAPDNLVVKLLRSEIINTTIPLWDLMMKNIYSLGAYQMSKEGFRLELLYRDDATGVPTNVIQNAKTAGISDRTLLNVFNIDKLDQNEFSVPEGDGYFDYIESLTVNSSQGYIIFPSVEPFGESLQSVFTDIDDAIYIFDELYDNTQSEARNNFQNKDKYFIKGYYKSEQAGGIPLGAFNVPQGSVKVTTGGRELIEGVDFVVDYQIGRVQIINPSLQASNAPIEVSVENNSVFNLQSKRFVGVDLEHKFSDKFNAGATILNLRERPLTQKTLFNSEPINNTIFGLRADYGTEVPKFTRWVNKLPNMDTDVESNFSVRGDFAYLLPGSPKRVELEGQATSYLDDFEGAQIPLELKRPTQWYLSSVPQGQTTISTNGDLLTLDYGYKRGKIAWYNVDQLFYGGSSLQPSNINDVELSRSEVRRIGYDELFPEQDLDITQSSVIRSLDLAYYPSERGSFNYDTNNVGADGKFTDPEDRWAGITRPLTVTNFEQANIEYIQFWMLDPYEHYSITEEEGLPVGTNPQDPSNQVGDLYFNLGNISEDVLKDGRKMYENGMPDDGSDTNTDTTIWGKIPKGQSLLYTFDINDNSRINQDIGLDGLNDVEETTFFGGTFGTDPSSDNYSYFRGGELDAANASILNRYKNYNNTQGNSPTASLSPESYPTSSTTYPDVEDINKDQTMNSVESYYQYKVSLNASDLVVGQNNIVDQKISTVTLNDGSQQTSRWLQFRIPINTPDEVINDMSGFNSIRFMRMFLTKFKMPVVLRFGELDLVRGDWRRYVKVIDETNNPNPPDLTPSQLQDFQVGVVNIEENESRSPIPYVIPPGIDREQLQGSTRIQFQNEQSLSMKVKSIPAGETRAVYKNVSIDLRMYKHLKMFIHAEGLVSNVPLIDDEFQGIIKLGSDLNDNYYQLEYPLKVTDFSSTSPEDIWKNNMDVVLKHLGKLKLLRFEEGIAPNIIYPAFGAVSPIEGLEGYQIRVKGNPSLSNVRVIMLGVKNNSDHRSSGEIWFNELRVSEFDNDGGWAAVVSADANFADFADVSVTGRVETIGFGGIEQRVNERSQDETKLYDVVTNINLGKVLPKNWGIQLPLNYSISEEVRDPKYDPQFQDVLFDEAKDINPNSDKSRDYTKRKSISLINVRKERSNTNPDKKQRFYDVENFSVSYAYNETQHKNYNIKKYLDQNVRASANYNHSFKPLSIEPFKNWGFLTKNKYLKFIKDFNFNLLPSTISVNSNIIRSYNEQNARSLVESLPELPTLKQRNFMFDWDYNIGYNLTKSLQFNFRALNSYVYDDFDRSEDIALFDNFFTLGRPQHYHQTLNGTYKIPIDKLPFLNFIRADYAYTADFDWQASSQSYIEQVGNSIQNSNTHNVSVDLDFNRFYKNIGLTKLLSKKKKSTSNKNQSTTNVPKAKNKKEKNSFAKTALGILMSIKKARISYQDNNGIFLPGYVPKVGFLGRDNYSGGLAPSLGFVFGSQIDIQQTALENGWLISRNINDPGGADDEAYYNRTYAKTHFDKFNVAIDLRPIKGLDIEVSANKIYTKSISQQLDVVNDLTLNETRFQDNLTSEYGNFSMSFNMIKTAFGSDADATFQEFKANRVEVSKRIAAQNGVDITNTNPDGTVVGFGPNSQQVMLPAFVAAYSGNSASSVNTNAFRDIPLPNWSMTYKGLMNNKWFKKTFQSFTLSHGYRSSYSINNFSNNLLFSESTKFIDTDLSGNFYNEKLLSNVNVIEEFSPLMKIDLKMKNSLSLKAELRKDRALNLNFNNNTLTEIRGKEYIVGVGYRIKDLKVRYKFDGKNQTIKGDLNLRADVKLRDDKTIIRDVDEDNDQVTGGQRLFSLTFKADYTLSRNLTASFYYDQNSSRYAVSTSFPRSSFSTGLMILYNLGN
ncbi:MAG: cell surface protein SprA [Candidatus Azotimanducaceae bacterium]